MLNMCSCMYSLMWLQLFNFVCVHSAYIPSPHGRPRFYHFGTLGPLFFVYEVVVCGISDWITQSGLENQI